MSISVARPMLEPGRKRTKNGYQWVIARAQWSKCPVTVIT
jgi:hypothetical protein